MNIVDQCVLNGGSASEGGFLFVQNCGVDSDQILIDAAGDGSHLIGSFIAHRGWAWWPVRNREGRLVGYVKKDALTAARMLS